MQFEKAWQTAGLYFPATVFFYFQTPEYIVDKDEITWSVLSEANPVSPDDWLNCERFMGHNPADKKLNKEVLCSIALGRNSRIPDINSTYFAPKFRAVNWWFKDALFVLLTKSDLTLLSKHEFKCSSIAESKGQGS